MTRAITVADAMGSSKLFSPFFKGASWNLWRAILKAMFGEPLDSAELDAFRSVTDRDPPKQRVREGVFIVGRGGGKDSAASFIATYIAMSFNPHAANLRPGEKAVVMCLAVDRDQAKIVFDYIRGYFERIPALAAMALSMNAASIELTNGVVIEVHTNSYRSVRGRSLLCCIFDELAFWRDENFAAPDVEVYGAVTPGLARVSGSMLVLISTAHRRSGLLHQRWKEHYGKVADDVLVARGTTTQFNSLFDKGVIDKAVVEDPQRYNAEYNSEWRDDLSTFLGRELIDQAVDRGVLVRPPVPSVRYSAFCDPSGGSADSMTLAIAHKEGEAVVLDLLLEKRAPFNPQQVVAEMVATLRQYKLNELTGDRYAAQWVAQTFAGQGVRYQHSQRDRSAIYIDMIPLFTSGKARLIDNRKLVAELAQLERRSTPTRDKVDHPQHGHDDCANSAAGALTLAAQAQQRCFMGVVPVLSKSDFGGRTFYGDNTRGSGMGASEYGGAYSGGASMRNPAHGLPRDGRDSWER